MAQILFSCAAELFTTFPALTVNALRVTGLQAAMAKANATAFLAEAVNACTIDPERVAEDEQVVAWREAYGLMGVKPSKFRSSIEALLRRAAKKGELAIPVPAVNFYNACSIRTKAPMGAYDIDRLGAGNHLELRKSRPATDIFDPLGGEASAFPLNSNLVVYAEVDAVLCWGFNCRDSKQACLTEHSDSAVFFSEAAMAIHQKPANQALSLMREKLLALGADCGDVQVADAAKQSISL